MFILSVLKKKIMNSIELTFNIITVKIVGAEECENTKEESKYISNYCLNNYFLKRMIVTLKM